MASDDLAHAAPAIRSVAADLRERTDDELVTLLRLRPELRSPVPTDFSTLSGRTTTWPAVTRALEQLDAFVLQVAGAVAALPEVTTEDDVRRLVGTDPAAALRTLRDLALVYGAPGEVRLVRTARELLDRDSGLGDTLAVAMDPARSFQVLRNLGGTPSRDEAADVRAIAALIGDRGWLDAHLDEAGERGRAVLDQLTWHGYGVLDGAYRDISDYADDGNPITWLLAHGLLVPVERDQVVLPREVAIALRGNRIGPPVTPEPPEIATQPVDPATVESGGASAAATFVRLTGELLELWAVDSPRVLRSGGVGVRERARTATALDITNAQLTLLLEVAHAAGLLGRGNDVDETWLPTPAYDAWSEWSTGARWAHLALAWLRMQRATGLAAAGPENGGKGVSPLTIEVGQAGAARRRRELLDLLLELPPGGKADTSSLVERLRWRRPRVFTEQRATEAVWALDEAILLGLVAHFSMAGPGRALLADDAGAEDAAADSLDTLLPEALDHVLLQADLTAIAPGPLDGTLAQRMGMVADVESRGAATVYRFSEGSVRRALDAGWTTADVLDLLGTHSRTPVPQPLTYLVEDVGRRHGRVRVGVASSYLRCDDEATVTEILADRRAAGLRLRRLAPTVLASPASVDTMLTTLRGMGQVPAAEGDSGEVVVRRPDSRRAPTPAMAPRVEPRPPAEVPDDVLRAAVAAIRAGDRARSAGQRAASATVSARHSMQTVDILALLQNAAAERDTVWISYVDMHGQLTERLIDPETVSGGYVEAWDHLRQDTRRFAVHRITAAAVVDVAEYSQEGGT